MPRVTDCGLTVIAPLPVESDTESVADEIPHTKAEPAKAEEESADTKMKDDAEDEDEDEDEEDAQTSVTALGGASGDLLMEDFQIYCGSNLGPSLRLGRCTSPKPRVLDANIATG